MDNFLKTVSKRTCSFCPNAKNDPSITTAIGDRLTPKLLTWPPNYTKDHSLRQVLSAIQSFEDSEAISLDPLLQICPIHVNELDPLRHTFGGLAECSSRRVFGLCLTCTKEDRTPEPMSWGCEHIREMVDGVLSMDQIQRRTVPRSLETEATSGPLKWCGEDVLFE